MSPHLTDLFLSSQSDERLVALARAGHERAFVAIVERYRRELAAQARRLDAGGRAEDIVQQTLLSAFAALRSGAEVEHLRGWLHQILRYAAMRSASRERPAVALDASVGATEPLEAAVESRMLARDLLSELAALPSRQRDAIVAMSIAGHSRADVASSMGLTEGAVRQLVHRARATLRTAVTALTPYPLARLLPSGGGGAAAGAGGASELAVGGTVSAGGAMIKLAAVLASGVLATAVVSHPFGHHAQRSTLRHRPAAAAATPRRPAAFGLSAGVVDPAPGEQASGSSRALAGSAGSSGGSDRGARGRHGSSAGRVAHGSPGGPGSSRGGGSSDGSGAAGSGGDAPGGSADGSAGGAAGGSSDGSVGGSGTTAGGSGPSGPDGSAGGDGAGQGASSDPLPGGSGGGGATQGGGGPTPGSALSAAASSGSGSDGGTASSDGGSGASSVPAPSASSSLDG